MAIETRVAQKDKLHALLIVQKSYEAQGIEATMELKMLIKQAITVMEAEDVSYVKEQVANG